MPVAHNPGSRSEGTVPRAAGEIPERLLWAWLVLALLVAALACYRIATQSIVLGSAEGRWVYRYLQPFSVRILLTGMSVAAASCVLLLSNRITGRDTWRTVFVWGVLAVALQAVLRSLTLYTFESIFVSDGANSFFGVTQRYYAYTTLVDFDRVRQYWPLHAQSNMPGKLLVLYALRQISKRPDVLPWLVIVVSNLGGFLMYGFVKELFGDRRVAVYSAILYLFVPAKLFFFPLMNSITPVAVLVCAYLGLRWMSHWSWVYAALLGTASYGLLIYEPLSLAIGALLVALMARALWQGNIAPLKVLAQTLTIGAAFLMTHAVMYLWFGFDIIRVFRQLAGDAMKFNVEAQRPYSIWVRENLREFLFGAGVAQAALVPAALMAGLWRAHRWKERLTEPITVVSVGVLTVLLAIDLIGVNRGEVIRLWIFLACFFQIPAAYVCARLESRAALALVLTLTILQGSFGTAMIGFIVPG
jgi:methylthioxylose transferase